MRRAVTIRILLLVGTFILSSLILPAPTQACELCFWHWLNPTRSYCRALQDRETGTTICTTFVDNLGGSDCTEGGDYCTVITVGGGGGSGSRGGGGGGGACQTSGFCPAECFSCSSGGGGGGSRPAV